jgi:hypothetical protein
MWRDCGVVVQQRGAASGDAAARGGTRISRVDFDLNLLTQFLSDSFAFRFKKKLVSFSLIQINRLREIWRDCGVVVQQSLPLPCVSRGCAHISGGLPSGFRGGHGLLAHVPKYGKAHGPRTPVPPC